MSASQHRPPTDLGSLLSDYLQHRDPQLLAEIFRRTNSILLSRARQWVDDPVLAEDLVQETFLTLLEAGHGFDPGRPAMPYIRGILYRKTRRALANARKDPASVCVSDKPDALASGEDHLDRIGLVELARKVLGAARQLPPRYREVLQLYLQEERTSREIGGILDRDPGTVRVQVHRGLQLLRNALPPGLAGTLAATLCLSHLRAACPPSSPATPGTPATPPAITVGRMTVAATLALLAVAGLAVHWTGGDPAPSAAGPAEPPAALQMAADQTAANIPEPASGERALMPASILRLRWSADGQPAAHVGALLVPLGRDADFHGQRFASGADGRIRLPRLEPGSYQLVLDRGLSRRLVVPSGGTLDSTIEMGKGVQVRGTVLDADGQPVPLARIWLTERNPDYWGGQVVCTANRNGTFRLRGLRPMSRLGALGPDGRPSRLRLITRRPQQEVRLQLVPETGSLLVQVVDAHRTPLPGAVVLVGYHPRQRMIPVPGGSVFEAGCPTVRGRTAADGSLEASNLPPGELHVLVRAAGKVARLCPAEITAGQRRRLTMTLSSAIQVSGRVVDPENQPVPGVLVHALGCAPHEWVTVLTDTTGRFRLDGVNPDGAELDVKAEGFQPAPPIQRARLQPGRPIRIKLQRQPWLRGRLRDARGRRIRDARVEVCVLGSGVNPLVKPPVAHAVDRQGGFVIPDDAVDPTYHVRSAHQEVWIRARPAKAADAAAPADIELVLPGGFYERGVLRGRIRGLPHAALEDALLVLERNGWHYTPGVQTDTRSGRFEVDPVPPGPYRVQLFGRLGRLPPLDLGRITIHSGPNDLGTLSLRSGTLRYGFELLDGAPIRQMTAWVTDERGMVIPLRGRAGTLALCPGRYWLSAFGVSFMSLDGLPFTIRQDAETSLPLRLERARLRQIQFRLPDDFDGARTSAEVHPASGSTIRLTSFDMGPGTLCGFAMVLAPGRYTLRLAAGDRQLSGSFQVAGTASTAPIEVPLYRD